MFISHLINVFFCGSVRPLLFYLTTLANLSWNICIHGTVLSQLPFNQVHTILSTLLNFIGIHFPDNYNTVPERNALSVGSIFSLSVALEQILRTCTSLHDRIRLDPLANVLKTVYRSVCSISLLIEEDFIVKQKVLFVVLAQRVIVMIYR